jgi:hypothetical protein
MLYKSVSGWLMERIARRRVAAGFVLFTVRYDALNEDERRFGCLALVEFNWSGRSLRRIQSAGRLESGSTRPAVSSNNLIRGIDLEKLVAEDNATAQPFWR